MSNATQTHIVNRYYFPKTLIFFTLPTWKDWNYDAFNQKQALWKISFTPDSFMNWQTTYSWIHQFDTHKINPPRTLLDVDRAGDIINQIYFLWILGSNRDMVLVLLGSSMCCSSNDGITNQLLVESRSRNQRVESYTSTTMVGRIEIFKDAASAIQLNFCVDACPSKFRGGSRQA